MIMKTCPHIIEVLQENISNPTSMGIFLNNNTKEHQSATLLKKLPCVSSAYSKRQGKAVLFVKMISYTAGQLNNTGNSK